MPPATTNRTELTSAVLRFELVGLPAVVVDDLTTMLATAAWAVGAATQRAHAEITGHPPALAYASWPEENRRNFAVVREIRYASPLALVLEIPPAVMESVTALAALMYIIKRVFAADLEIRTAREEQRARYLEARARAQRALEEDSDPVETESPQRWAYPHAVHGRKALLLGRIASTLGYQVRIQESARHRPGREPPDEALDTPGLTAATRAARRRRGLHPTTTNATLEDQRD